MILITALSLCSLFCGSQTVEVKPGEDVTLRCSNISSSECVTFWFRLDNRATVDCISVMIKSSSKPTYYDGFKGGKFEMSSNISTIFLKIKQVDSSDSGQYFCGFYESPRLLFSVTHLNVAGNDPFGGDTRSNSENEFGGRRKLISVIPGALTVLLVIVIIGLAVKIMKLQTAVAEGHKLQQMENLDSDATLSLHSAAMRRRTPASEREVETHVIYAAK
ncbi:T-cell surface glycoprotein CD8 beta chain-like [Stegastes partitus]|uniref:T-cell surface glycoprotein CD8 beta chain-like n=1 Tax=Stegastes partitus TaxID=144197 RepID=A0A9Y4JZH9_9TELE|nr:PREDICTED: T-cell surface glycoprotein CD8 beta chain-like [Stegastes partitus]